MTPTPAPFHVKCDRWDECQRERKDLQDRIEEVRREKREDNDKLWAAVNTMVASVARLEGRLAGYLLAATVLGTVVAFIAQKVMQ